MYMGRVLLLLWFDVVEFMFDPYYLGLLHYGVLTFNHNKYKA